MDHTVAGKSERKIVRFIFGNSDRTSGLAICLISAAALLASMDLPYGSVRAPDSGFFPKTLSVLLLIFGAGIYARSFSGGVEKLKLEAGMMRVVVAAAALCAYAFVLNFIGFVIATILVLMLMMRGFSDMTWRASGLIAAMSVAISYVGFIQLGVPLPKGPLPF
ncbi:tripartite tricarboxylate transporter TctB family protein [Bradyrhizobium sp. NP1]|uniref:tripartite tricarboxylate transporter TctB family protein n=1 Tax=Bradyrhizobium sp. NP1 TaxID=3049772 RepID=UPI0025A66732|nr:tripartite tricarboxylate transporter TctB family protein [Bradyrhizobium sp. NP1]WJR76853.1 tripartite tricarboxylate transporter TctB family protein [Bradyrhizobium sp. NP1]